MPGSLNSLYSNKLYGGLILIGNTCALTYSSNVGDSSAGDYMTPAGGTTRDWTQAGSSAILTLPSNSSVEYAWLFWYSTVKNGSNSVVSSQDNSITFTTANGVNTITPTSTLNLDHNGDSSYVTRYRGATVTNLVTTAGSGTYTVKGIPTYIPSSGGGSSRCGWAMYVVYRNALQSFRSISIYAGAQLLMGTTTGPIDITITGFITPSTTTPPIKGYFFATTGDGDANADNTRVRAGINTSSLTNIGNSVNQPNTNPNTPPNNPGNNFFGGQINVADPNNPRFGLIDTSGTKGNLNINPFVPSQAVGARTKWDVSGVDISSILTANQASLVVRTDGTTSNAYVELTSQAVMIDLNSPRFSNLTSSVDKSYVDIGDTLTYTVSFSNTGTLTANNVIFQNTIPNWLSFVSGSVVINNIQQPTYNPQNSINIGDIAINQGNTISFKTKVVTIPSPNPINNTAFLGFTFSPSVGVTISTNAEISNGSVQVNHADASISKSVKSYVDIGEIFTYTIPITVTGNTPLSNIVLTDTLPNNLLFITDSLKLNGVTQNGIFPEPGFRLSNIPIGANTITFKVITTIIPTVNPINSSANLLYYYIVDPSIPKIAHSSANSSNASTQVNHVYLNIPIVANKGYGKLNDILTYTISLINSGNITANNTIFKSTVPNNTSFVTNSITLNGVTLTGTNPSTSFSLGTIPIGTTTVTYKVILTTLPNTNEISNSATLTYTYTVDPSTPNTIASSANSNILSTPSNQAILNSINVSADKSYLNENDVLTYTLSIKNTGNAPATNVIIRDTIPNGILFINNSVAVNGTTIPGANILAGANIGSIPAGITSTITFKLNASY